MMVPRQRFRRISWLDYMVRRFQDRWETNPQYRAMVSGVVGLVLIVTLCSCTGLMTLVTNNALASLGLTNGNGSNNINSQTGTGNVKDGINFPTPTFGAATPLQTPVGSPIPSSQTPPPAATETATVVTDNPTATTGGGGPNTAQFVCTGKGNGITWTFSPCPLVHGQGGSLTISAPAHPNTGTNILVNFGNCTTSNCTIDDPPSSTFQTNGSGTEVISFTVPADVQVGGPQVTGMIQLSSGQSVGIDTVGSVT